MKNLYLLLSAACVAASASAVEKQALPARNVVGQTPLAKEQMAPVGASKQANMPKAQLKKAGASTRAAGVKAFYRPARNIWAIGASENGYAFNGATYAFGSSYGSFDFLGFTTEGAKREWIYSEFNDYEVVDKQADWNLKTSDAEILSVKSTVGEMYVPSISADNVTYESPNVKAYLAGGSANSWIGQDELGGDCGVSCYQNFGLMSADGKYNGMLTYNSSYMPGAPGFNAAGVYVDPEDWNNWQTTFDQQAGTEVKNLVMDNFSLLWPTPGSTYSMTRSWGNISISASKDTQLISYLYPLDEEGVMAEMPVALGYASVSKGDTNWIVFEYNPLDENGDEIEDDIFIDSAMIMTIEGFAGNDAITSISIPSGYAPVSYEAYQEFGGGMVTMPTLFMQFSFDVDGETYTTLDADYAFWLYDDTDPNHDSVTLGSYHKFSVDAVFAYIQSVDGVDTVNVPLEGGSASVDLEAYWYNIPDIVEAGYYEVSAPEWLSVDFVLDPETGVTTMTVSAEAGSDRTGIVTIEGLGATYSLTVNQGAGNAVSSISIEKGAQYFDLQGRRVANPEKGIFIKKSADKAEKVIL